MLNQNQLKIKSQDGFILIHLIMSVFLLVAILFVFKTFVFQFQKKLFFRTEFIQEQTAERSLIYKGMDILTQDDAKIDSLNDLWARDTEERIDHFKLKRKIIDETGKLNLNQLICEDKELKEEYERFIRELLEKLKITAHDAESIIEYVQKKGPLMSVSDLEAIKGDLSIDLNRINFERYFTVHSTGRINVNTAPYEVLEVLLEGIGPFLVKEIIEKRDKTPYSDLSELKGVANKNTKFLTLNSSCFKIKVFKGESESNASLCVVVQRDIEGLKVREWLEN